MRKEVTKESLPKIVDAINRPVYLRAILTDLIGCRDTVEFLLQVKYWWRWKGERYGLGEPFYKLQSPCKHPSYKIGDTWKEELALTKYKMEKVLKKVATRVSGAKMAQEYLDNGTTYNDLVIYFIDSTNLGWYYLNENLFFEIVLEAIENREAQNLKNALEFGASLKKEGSSTLDTTYEDPEVKSGTPFLKTVVPITTTQQNNNNNKIEKFEEKFKTDSNQVNAKYKGVKKPRTPERIKQQRDFAEMQGEKMPLHFTPSDDILLEAINNGYAIDDIYVAVARFRNYYTEGKGKNRKALDWNRVFIDNWLINAYEFGYISRNGTYRRTDANTRRLEDLERKAELDRTGGWDNIDLDETYANIKEIWAEHRRR